LKEVVVLRDFQNGVPMVLGNEGELIQVFTSIIVNALDAMEDKGTLAFATEIAGNIVFVKICDTGPGISPGLINRIFDPFFTTKSEKGGTGLGLSIVDKIIKENNGGIDVTSEEGRGTTFTITLPI
jgi:signal transduction histidine kinase